MTTPEQKLEQQIQIAVQEYLQNTQAFALKAVQRAFKTAASVRTVRKKHPPLGQARPAPQKRDPAVIEALTDQLLACIKQSPGQTMRQLAQQIGQPPRALLVPAQKLKSKGLIKAVGQRQQTTYFPKAPKKEAV